MALKKAITNKKGVTTNYHKIGNFSVRKTDNERYTICAQVLSFVSEEYRRLSEANAVVNIDYIVRADADEISTTPILALAYDKLKTLPTFDGAEDC